MIENNITKRLSPIQIIFFSLKICLSRETAINAVHVRKILPNDKMIPSDRIPANAFFYS